jgi:excisionase family DNA binding protein
MQVGDSIIKQLKATSGAISAPDIARLLGVSRVTVYRLAKRGLLPSFRIATAVRFDPSAVAAWLEGGAR